MRLFFSTGLTIYFEGIDIERGCGKHIAIAGLN